MKFEAPPGSVFGGYGFWTYSSTPDLQPSAGNRHPQKGTGVESPGPPGSMRGFAEGRARLSASSAAVPVQFGVERRPGADRPRHARLSRVCR